MPERYVGRTLGKYRIDALVGSGGFAWVYKAFDPALEIPVALKVLKPQYSGDETFEQRFRREASTAAKLRHPNIVKIFAVDKHDGASYFAMDFLPQGLADRLRVMTTIPEPMLIRIGMDVASALSYAHREGIVHRDIKVDNILFDEHGNAVVADFGIARAVAGYIEQTGTNMVMGTPQYFAPEQARGLALDGRADLYSLGVTLFKAATGELPFNGDDWYEIARQHVEDRPPRPRTLNPAISRDLEHVILKCLEKRPEDRFANGDALGETLRDMQDSQRTGTTNNTLKVPLAELRWRLGSMSRWHRAFRTTRARWTAFAASLALLALLALQLGDNTSSAPAGVVPDPINGEPVLALPPVPRVLTVSATDPGTRYTVNGVFVGSGRSWRADTLAPGEYEVIAAIDSPALCPTAADTISVDLRLAERDSVGINPRGCGSLTFQVRNVESARYSVRPAARRGGAPIQGSLPLSSPLVLTPGSYSVTVTGSLAGRACSPYEETLTVAKGATRTVTASLLCE